MLKSDVSIEKIDELKSESGCGCGGSCACGKAEPTVDLVEVVASEDACGCGSGSCC